MLGAGAQGLDVLQHRRPCRLPTGSGAAEDAEGEDPGVRGGLEAGVTVVLARLGVGHQAVGHLGERLAGLHRRLEAVPVAEDVLRPHQIVTVATAGDEHDSRDGHQGATKHAR